MFSTPAETRFSTANRDAERAASSAGDETRACLFTFPLHELDDDEDYGDI